MCGRVVMARVRVRVRVRVALTMPGNVLRPPAELLVRHGYGPAVCTHGVWRVSGRERAVNTLGRMH